MQDLVPVEGKQSQGGLSQEHDEIHRPDSSPVCVPIHGEDGNTWVGSCNGQNGMGGIHSGTDVDEEAKLRWHIRGNGIQVPVGWPDCMSCTD